MKNEEAITCIKMMFAFWANAHKLNVAQMEAAKDLSIAALGNGGFIETRKMVPLTLEQLRGMKKVTPVWWEGAGFWCLAQSGGIVTPFGQCYDVEGLPGEFYAYPPAHIDREAWKPCEKCVGCGNCNYFLYDDDESPCDKCLRGSTDEKPYPEFSPIAFCKHCGWPLTPEARAIQEKRLRG